MQLIDGLIGSDMYVFIKFIMKKVIKMNYKYVNLYHRWYYVLLISKILNNSEIVCIYF